MNEFKLKPNEIDILRKWGNTEDDIAQIEEGVNYATFKTNKKKKCRLANRKTYGRYYEFLIWN